jgi:hypothetical protein
VQSIFAAAAIPSRNSRKQLHALNSISSEAKQSTMAKKAASNQPFKPGDRCNRKGAPHCPGRILRADPDAVDAAGHKKKGVWVVEFDVAATGEKSIEQGISSRMLTRSSVEQEVVNRPTVGNAYVPIKNRPCRTTAVAAVPSLLETDASSSHNEEDAAESSSNDSDDGHQEEEAKKENYRMFSFGDAMLII